MIELTPELAGTSLVVMVIMYIVVFAFNIYMLYLNWKQSKVKDSVNELVVEVKNTNKLLEKLLEKTK